MHTGKNMKKERRNVFLDKKILITVNTSHFLINKQLIFFPFRLAGVIMLAECKHPVEYPKNCHWRQSHQYTQRNMHCLPESHEFSMSSVHE